MARMSPEERKAHEDALAADDAADDDDAEQVTVSIGDRSFTGTLRAAQEFAAAHGFSLRPAPKAETKADGKDGGTVKRFSGRRVS